MTMQTPPDRRKMQETADLLRGLFTGAYVSGMVALGLELGLYRALAGAGALTSEEVAARTGLRERWLREWLRGQAAARVLEYDGAGRFTLTEEGAAFLADEDSLLYLGGNFSGLRQRLAALERLPESFRSGLGQTWDDRGPEHAAGTELLFRNWYRLVLVQQALPLLDGVVERLRAGAVVADVGCGSGIALAQMARAFPRSSFHGYDISRHALDRAARNADEQGATNIARHRADIDPLPGDGSFALVTTFDCLHDMTRPEMAAAAIRGALSPDGAWFIADIDGAATFEENLAQNRNAPMMYAMSVLSCMSSALSEEGGAGLGTLGLPEPALRELAAGAGFTRFRRLDLPHPVNAFYEARP